MQQTCFLIFHLAVLLNSLMSSSSFLVASLGFSKYIVSRHLQTVTVLLLSNLDSSSLIAVARIFIQNHIE